MAEDAVGSQTSTGDAQPTTSRLAAAVRKARWRLLPLLGFCYVLSYLDRVNVGFAAVSMRPDLRMSATAYGLGAGLFFIGYFLFEAVALFFLAVPLTSVVGGPLSGLLIDHGAGVLGFDHGWRFMFFVEGIPAVIMGVVVYFVLTNRPKDAKWLDPGEREALERAIAAEDSAQVPHPTGIRAGLVDWRVLALAVVYFGVVFGNYVLAFFLPQVIAQLKGSLTSTQIGLVNAVSYLVAAIALVLVARHSDRTGSAPGTS